MNERTTLRLAHAKSWLIKAAVHKELEAGVTVEADRHRTFCWFPSISAPYVERGCRNLVAHQRTSSRHFRRGRGANGRRNALVQDHLPRGAGKLLQPRKLARRGQDGGFHRLRSTGDGFGSPH